MKSSQLQHKKTKWAQKKIYSGAWLLKEKYQAMNLYGRFIINHSEDIDSIVRSGIFHSDNDSVKRLPPTKTVETCHEIR
jgi:hypothetical protein